MSGFDLISDFKPTGDQPQAIDALGASIEAGRKHQTLLGVTGSGKTFTMANVVQRIQRPTLVMAHNKTLAAQLASEFKEFFPNNAVEYFVSYYDYYQPEAYIPRSDTYIEKDTLVNEDIERLRHSAMQSLLTRRDVLVVASVSCIYGLGDPEEYGQNSVSLRVGEIYKRDKILRRLTDIYYERNDYDLSAGKFRVRGDTLEVHPSSQEIVVRISFWGDELERITEVDPLTGEVLADRQSVEILPSHLMRAAAVYLAAAIALPLVGSPERMEEAIFPLVIGAALVATRTWSLALVWLLAVASDLFVARVGGDARLPTAVAWAGLVAACGLALWSYVSSPRITSRRARAACLPGTTAPWQ